MDEEMRDALQNVIQGLNALTEVIERSINFGLTEGTGDLMIKQYRGLYFRASQLLPGDTYLQEYLSLDPLPKANDDQKIVQANLLSGQLLLYLRGIVKSNKARGASGEDVKVKEMGRELRDQIVDATRDAVKRVLSQSEIEADSGEESQKSEGNLPPQH